MNDLLDHFSRRVMQSPGARRALAGWDRVIAVESGGPPAYLRVADGRIAPLDGRPDTLDADIHIVGDPVCIAAVFGGYLTPRAAWREGQLTQYAGTHSDCDRLDDLLARLH